LHCNIFNEEIEHLLCHVGVLAFKFMMGLFVFPEMQMSGNQAFYWLTSCTV